MKENLANHNIAIQNILSTYKIYTDPILAPINLNEDISANSRRAYRLVWPYWTLRIYLHIFANGSICWVLLTVQFWFWFICIIQPIADEPTNRGLLIGQLGIVGFQPIGCSCWVIFLLYIIAFWGIFQPICRQPLKLCIYIFAKYMIWTNGMHTAPIPPASLSAGIWIVIFCMYCSQKGNTSSHFITQPLFAIFIKY